VGPAFFHLVTNIPECLQFILEYLRSSVRVVLLFIGKTLLRSGGARQKMIISAKASAHAGCSPLSANIDRCASKKPCQNLTKGCALAGWQRLSRSSLSRIVLQDGSISGDTSYGAALDLLVICGGDHPRSNNNNEKSHDQIEPRPRSHARFHSALRQRLCH
jgi:hypothetical protein